jgi:hypothetical protein
MEKLDSYLSNFVNQLRAAFSSEAGWEFDIKVEEGLVRLRYSDAYDVIDVLIFLNEFKVPFEVSYIRASRSEEVATPEACHSCDCESCERYNAESNECTITQEEVEGEIDKWEGKLVDTRHVTVKRVIVEEECFLDVPHYHYYKGYEIIYRGPITPDVVLAIDLLFDDIVDLAEEAA